LSRAAGALLEDPEKDLVVEMETEVVAGRQYVLVSAPDQ